MSRIHVFTSAAGNYLPKVKVLFDSLAVHHPEWQRHLLLVEDWPEAQCAAVALDAELHQPRDLGIPEWRPWAFCHSMVELCTAVKPFMLKQLLAREDCDAVIYLDPDICVFASLVDVEAALAANSILLTPHQSSPEATLSGVMANELTSLRYGTYNLGFIAVAANAHGRGFAEWWSQRAYRFTRDDVPNGLFTDQRWIDLVPGLFEGVCVLRESHLNVASWNAHQRELTKGADGQVLASGKPLGFYHFTGLDSGNHDAAMQYAGQSDGVQADLVQNYREALAKHARLYPCSEWSFGCLSDGMAIETSWRHAYRDDAALQARFPDPWRASGMIDVLRRAASRGNSAFVSPGFVAGERDEIDVGRLGRYLAQATKQPLRLRVLLRSVARIFGREGWRGLRRRISRSGGERM